jgi:hypothetical protein
MRCVLNVAHHINQGEGDRANPGGGKAKGSTVSYFCIGTLSEYDFTQSIPGYSIQVCNHFIYCLIGDSIGYRKS